MLKSFRELEVWQKSHAVVLEIYRATAEFPSTEKYGIVSQLRRAAMSIPANIAEGFGRRGTKEFLQSLAIASGSLEESRYFLLLSNELGYLSTDKYKALESRCDSVGQMLGALSRSLRERSEGVLRTTGRGSQVAIPRITRIAKG